jgi:hypothetical protein
MIRYCWLLLFFPLYAHAQKLSGADLRKIKLYCSGSFSNAQQVKADSASPATIRIQTIWIKRKDGIWLFADKKDSAMHAQIWHFYLQDDTTLILQTLDFRNNFNPNQLRENIADQSKLTIYNLVSHSGCEIYIKRNKSDGYHGTSSGKDCYADTGGARYYRYEVYIDSKRFSWTEQWFDKDDHEITHSKEKAVVFNRAVSPKQ